MYVYKAEKGGVSYKMLRSTALALFYCPSLNRPIVKQNKTRSIPSCQYYSFCFSVFCYYYLFRFSTFFQLVIDGEISSCSTGDAAEIYIIQWNPSEMFLFYRYVSPCLMSIYSFIISFSFFQSRTISKQSTSALRDSKDATVRNHAL